MWQACSTLWLSFQSQREDLCHPWRCLRCVWMWYLGTWFNGGLGSVRLMVVCDDHKGLFQPKPRSRFAIDHGQASLLLS